MTTAFSLQATRSCLLFAVFLLFIASVTGVIQLGAASSGFIAVDFSAFRTGSALHATVFSPGFYALLITGLILCLALPLLSPLYASLLTLVSAIPPFYISWLNVSPSSVINLDFSLWNILSLYGVNVLVSYFLETRSRQRMTSLFGQYVPPEVVHALGKDSGQVNLQGEARVLTVFFCDLINFSGVAEQLNPRQLATLLNEYFTAMTTILYRHGSTIDKYIGDSIMAFWGAPLPQQDHARRSVAASFEMHEEIKRLSGEFISRGWPGPTMGVGINTGIMNVGNMGSKYRIAYTVVGDAVNLAARLQSLTRVYKVPTIVSEQTRDAVDDIIFRELDIVQVKGKQNRTRIYEPLCLQNEATPELLHKLERHERALEELHTGNTDNAIRQFSELYHEYREDGYYRYILGRLKEQRN